MATPRAAFEDLIVCAVSLDEKFESPESFFGSENLGQNIRGFWESIDMYISKYSGELLSRPMETVLGVWSPDQSVAACQCALGLVSGRWNSSSDRGYFRSGGLAGGRSTVELQGGHRTRVIGGGLNKALMLAVNLDLQAKRVYAAEEIPASSPLIQANLVLKGGLVTPEGKRDIYEIERITESH